MVKVVYVIALGVLLMLAGWCYGTENAKQGKISFRSFKTSVMEMYHPNDGLLIVVAWC